MVHGLVDDEGHVLEYPRIFTSWRRDKVDHQPYHDKFKIIRQTVIMQRWFAGISTFGDQKYGKSHTFITSAAANRKPSCMIIVSLMILATAKG